MCLDIFIGLLLSCWPLILYPNGYYPNDKLNKVINGMINIKNSRLQIIDWCNYFAPNRLRNDIIIYPTITPKH